MRRVYEVSETLEGQKCYKCPKCAYNIKEYLDSLSAAQPRVRFAENKSSLLLTDAKTPSKKATILKPPVTP